MSNRTSSNPIVVDTAGATITRPRIIAMVWQGTEAANRDIAINDDLTITLNDTNGQTVFAKRALSTTDGVNISFSEPWCPGQDLYIKDIDGGELFIFLA